MAQDDFDLEAALQNVHSAGSRPKVERAHVFLPESMRAERKPNGKKAERVVPQQLPLKPRLPDWSILNDPNRLSVQTFAQNPEYDEKVWNSVCRCYEKHGIEKAIRKAESYGLYPYQAKELVEGYIAVRPARLSKDEALKRLQKPRTPQSAVKSHWQELNDEQVGEILRRHAEGKSETSLANLFHVAVSLIFEVIGCYAPQSQSPSGLLGRQPAKQGCVVCGSTTVACRPDGSPFDHKCSHKMWCRTINGHAGCAECAKEWQHVAEEDLVREARVRREFAENVKKADEKAPRVGYDVVEVVAPASCPMCHELLQGKRAVRVWVWDKETRGWRLNNYQCLKHHKPGVPMAEMAGQYFQREQYIDWVHFTRVLREPGGGTRYRVLNPEKLVVWERWVGAAEPQTAHLAAERDMEQAAKAIAASMARGGHEPDVPI